MDDARDFCAHGGQYPLTFGALRALAPGPIVLLNVRNLLLIALFVWVVIPERRRSLAPTDGVVALEGGDVREAPNESRPDSEHE